MTARSRKSQEDQTLTVAKLADEAGVEKHVVRFYARSGLIRATRHAPNGYRQFTLQDVKRIRFIRAAQSLGFTLAEIGEIFRRSRARKTPCPLVRDIIVKRVVENRERLDHMRALQERMEGASERWRHMPDHVPDGDTICTLIEAVADASDVDSRPASIGRIRRS